MCLCVCVSFRLALPKPLKTKRIKTQPEQQEEQLTLARCCQLTAFRQLSGTQTDIHRHRHTWSHTCALTPTQQPAFESPPALCIRKSRTQQKRKLHRSILDCYILLKLHNNLLKMCTSRLIVLVLHTYRQLQRNLFPH